MKDSYIGWKGWQGADFGLFSTEDALYFTEELRISGINSVSGLSVGELGYGNGAFAGWVQKSGGCWVGCEAIPELQKRAAEAGFDVVSSGTDFSKAFKAGSFDLIVAFDVVEHIELEEVRSFLREAKDALKPRGMLLLRIPSGDSPFSGAIYRGDLTHRTLLGSSAVRQLGMEAGLDVCQIRSPSLPVWGLGSVRAVRRMVIRFTQAVVFFVVRHALMGKGDAVVSPNMIVVLRKEKEFV